MMQLGLSSYRNEKWTECEGFTYPYVLLGITLVWAIVACKIFRNAIEVAAPGLEHKLSLQPVFDFLALGFTQQAFH